MCSKWKALRVHVCVFADVIVCYRLLTEPLLSLFFSVLCLSSGALTKAKESQKHGEEKDGTAGGGINDRCNIISCATLAEIQHFHRVRVRDFKAQMQHFLQQQISFFQKITGKLEEALDMYDQA